MSSQSSSDGKAVFEKLQQNYLACMDTETVKAETGLGLSGILSNIKNMFSVSDYTSNATMSLSTDDNVKLANLQAYLNGLGINVLTSYSTLQDPENPTTFAPVVQPADNSALATALTEATATELVEGVQKLLPNGTTQAAAEQLVESLQVLITQIGTLAAALPPLDAVSNFSHEDFPYSAPNTHAPKY
jgi:hypothetical protein